MPADPPCETQSNVKIEMRSLGPEYLGGYRQNSELRAEAQFRDCLRQARIESEFHVHRANDTHG